MMNDTLQGGTRLDGQSPLKQAGLPVVSVITVVYNSLSLIEKTITSIIEQTYPNIEFIVIDGGSSDGTVELIRLYENKISYWISEPDRGIYDAMNKGLAAATGDYVWFINAGDRIYTPETTEKIFATTETPHGVESLPFIYYGDTMIVDAEYHEVGLRRLRPPEILTWKSFKKGMLVCHQAIIVARSIAEPFDPQYKHSADFDWVVRALMKAEGRRQKAEISKKRQELSKKGKEARHKAKEPRDMAKEVRDKLKVVKEAVAPGVITNPGLQAGDVSGDGTLSGAMAGAASGAVSLAGALAGDTTPPSTLNTHLILCSFLDGGHSKQNISISLRERFHSMARHYGLVPTVLRHIPIAIKFVWYYLINKRF